eukprot:evm.model.scf_2024.1 EVM.evm.TU.scf_2024.1   scf_2024:885-8376(+)
MAGPPIYKGIVIAEDEADLRRQIAGGQHPFLHVQGRPGVPPRGASGGHYGASVAGSPRDADGNDLLSRALSSGRSQPTAPGLGMAGRPVSCHAMFDPSAASRGGAAVGGGPMSGGRPHRRPSAQDFQRARPQDAPLGPGRPFSGRMPPGSPRTQIPAPQINAQQLPPQAGEVAHMGSPHGHLTMARPVDLSRSGDAAVGSPSSGASERSGRSGQVGPRGALRRALGSSGGFGSRRDRMPGPGMGQFTALLMVDEPEEGEGSVGRGRIDRRPSERMESAPIVMRGGMPEIVHRGIGPSGGQGREEMWGMAASAEQQGMGALGHGQGEGVGLIAGGSAGREEDFGICPPVSGMHLSAGGFGRVGGLAASEALGVAAPIVRRRSQPEAPLAGLLDQRPVAGSASAGLPPAAPPALQGRFDLRVNVPRRTSAPGGLGARMEGGSTPVGRQGEEGPMQHTPRLHPYPPGEVKSPNGGPLGSNIFRPFNGIDPSSPMFVGGHMDHEHFPQSPSPKVGGAGVLTPRAEGQTPRAPFRGGIERMDEGARARAAGPGEGQSDDCSEYGSSGVLTSDNDAGVGREAAGNREGGLVCGGYDSRLDREDQVPETAGLQGSEYVYGKAGVGPGDGVGHMDDESDSGDSSCEEKKPNVAERFEGPADPGNAEMPAVQLTGQGVRSAGALQQGDWLTNVEVEGGSGAGELSRDGGKQDPGDSVAKGRPVSVHQGTSAAARRSKRVQNKARHRKRLGSVRRDRNVEKLGQKERMEVLEMFRRAGLGLNQDDPKKKAKLQCGPIPKAPKPKQLHACDVLELALCSTGTATSTAEDIRKVCAWWVELAASDASQSRRWRGNHFAEVFGDPDPVKAAAAIEKCLRQNHRQFQVCGRDENGQNVWRARHRTCDGLGFVDNAPEDDQREFNESVRAEWERRQQRVAATHQQRKAKLSKKKKAEARSVKQGRSGDWDTQEKKAKRRKLAQEAAMARWNRHRQAMAGRERGRQRIDDVRHSQDDDHTLWDEPPEGEHRHMASGSDATHDVDAQAADLGQNGGVSLAASEENQAQHRGGAQEGAGSEWRSSSTDSDEGREVVGLRSDAAGCVDDLVGGEDGASGSDVESDCQGNAKRKGQVAHKGRREEAEWAVRNQESYLVDADLSKVVTKKTLEAEFTTMDVSP